MYYSFYDDDDDSNCRFKFNDKKISTKEEVNEEIEFIFRFLKKHLKKSHIRYDSCGIIPCIGLFINGNDIKRFFKSELEDKFKWTLSGIDVLDDYVSIRMNTTFCRDGDHTKYFNFSSDEKRIFIMKYSDFLSSFNIFKYRLENMPRTFQDYKGYFLLGRSLYADSDVDYDPCIVFNNSQPRTDTQIISFQDAVNARRLTRE